MYKITKSRFFSKKIRLLRFFFAKPEVVFTYLYIYPTIIHFLSFTSLLFTTARTDRVFLRDSRRTA